MWSTICVRAVVEYSVLHCYGAGNEGYPQPPTRRPKTFRPVFTEYNIAVQQLTWTKNLKDVANGRAPPAGDESSLTQCEFNRKFLTSATKLVALCWSSPVPVKVFLVSASMIRWLGSPTGQSWRALVAWQCLPPITPRTRTAPRVHEASGCVMPTGLRHCGDSQPGADGQRPTTHCCPSVVSP